MFVELSIWRLTVLALLVLMLRRIPIVLCLYKFVPLIKNWREALFTGWFGPVGVGAIFYYAKAIEGMRDSNIITDDRKPIAGTLTPIVYFIVLSSVIIHGLSIPVVVAVQYVYRSIITPPTDIEKATGITTTFVFKRTTTGNMSEATTAVSFNEPDISRRSPSALGQQTKNKEDSVKE